MRIKVIRGVAVFLAGATLSYLRFVRPYVLNWNATDEEARRDLPGDGIVAEAAIQTTRCITIDAPPSDVWPWLVQMRPKPRAGAYTYDWVERLLGIDIENTDRILPEFQQLEEGELLGLDEKGSGLRVREVAPEQHLVLQWVPAESSWAFVLEPTGDGGTRLLSRNRIPGAGWKFWAGMVGFMEPGSLVMERKMLLGIKERAEGSLHAAPEPR